MARTVEVVGANHDLRADFIRVPAAILTAPMTVAFPTDLSDIIWLTDPAIDEVQTVTITGTPTGGTFKLSFRGDITASIAYNAAASAVQSALEALGSIGSGGVVASAGPLPGTAVTITFASQLGDQAVPQIVVASSALTGGTSPAVATATTTPGSGLYDAKAGWEHLGPTIGGITVDRNNSEEAFNVDQIQADILTLPNATEMGVAATLSKNSIDALQRLWELGTITALPSGNRSIGMGTITSYRQFRVAVLIQRQSFDGGVTPGLIRGYCFRRCQRAAQESSHVFNREGPQAGTAFRFKALAESWVSDSTRQFGDIIDQAPAT